MPSVENHVRFCVKVFGEENRELCYMINSWMDAPSRELGTTHRIERHHLVLTPFQVCQIYGDNNAEKRDTIAKMVLQHLRLDGLITPEQEKAWSWNWVKSELKRMEEQKREAEKLMEKFMEQRRKEAENRARITRIQSRAWNLSTWLIPVGSVLGALLFGGLEYAVGRIISHVAEVIGLFWGVIIGLIFGGYVGSKIADSIAEREERF